MSCAEILSCRFEEDGNKVNSFANAYYDFKDYPDLLSKVQVYCDNSGFILPTKVDAAGSNVPVGRFELQKHTISIEEHTDDIPQGEFFGLHILKLDRIVESPWDARPEFSFYSSQGKKENVRLVEDETLVFNPRKKHRLIFYGYAPLLALFTIKKGKPE